MLDSEKALFYKLTKRHPIPRRDHKDNQKNKTWSHQQQIPKDCSIIRAGEGVFKQFLLTLEEFEGEDKNLFHCCLNGEMNDSSGVEIKICLLMKKLLLLLKNFDEIILHQFLNCVH